MKIVVCPIWSGRGTVNVERRRTDYERVLLETKNKDLLRFVC